MLWTKLHLNDVNVMVPNDVYIQKAFNALVKRHRPDIYTVTYRMLGNRRDAGGITHTAFLAPRNHIQAFQGRTKFGTWLYRIAVNRCLQYKKTKT